MVADNTVGPVSQSTAVSAITPQTHSTPETSSTISGTIVGRDPNGNFLLKTQGGNLTLQSNLPLTYNSDLIIKVDQNAQGTNARIVSVNGQPFSEFSQSLPPEADSVSTALLAQSSGSTSAAQDPQSASLPVVVRADVLAATPDNAAPPQPQTANQTPLPAPGTTVTIHLPVTPAQVQAPIVTVQPDQVPLQEEGNTPQPPAPAPQQQSIQLPVSETPVAAPQASAATAQSQAAAVTTNVAAAATPSSTVANATKLSPSVQETTPAPAQQQEAVAAPQLPEGITNTPQTSASPFYAAYAKQNVNVVSAELQNTPNVTTQVAVATPSIKTSSVQGQIVSSAEDGSITVQTEAGTITLQPQALPASATLAPGTAILLDIPENTTQNILTSTVQNTPAPPASLGEIAATWNTIKEIVNVITGTTSDIGNAPQAGTTPAAQTPANNIISNLPVLGENFAATSLAFMTALASGNIAKILGDDTVNTLKQNGRTDLIQKFSAEMTNLLSVFTPKPESQQQPAWQASFMPFIFQGEVQQARIYVKRDGQNKKQSDDARAAGNTRFIVEVDLSEFGGIQMDGLVRMKQAGTVFDLMIRSRHPFTAQEQQEMTEIYNSAAVQTGFSGMLAFQTTNDFPVKPLDEILAHHTNNITA
ncbi:MAG TPA: hypothetical protein VFT64_08390 [Rickettsiales bacterium]|nr:hypothetical protein [Rickettsiales bacterium]